MSALARWCFRHRFVVIAAWLLILVGLGAASTVIGSSFSDKFTLPGTQSTKANELLASQFKNSAGDSDTIVLHAKTGKVTDAGIESAVTATLAQIAKAPQVGSVGSPYTAQGKGQISRNGEIAYATVTFTPSRRRA